MPVAAVTGAVGLYSAHEASSATKDASKASQQASDQAIAEQRREYDLMQQNLQPYMGAGTNALADWNKLMSGDYSGFDQSPDYLYARDQAQYVIDHSAANAGDLYSGGHSLDLAHEINGIASQNLGAYRNSLYQLAGLGQASAAGVGAAGMGMASNIGGYLTNNAANQGAYAQQQAGINGQLAAGLGGAFSNYWNSRPANTATAIPAPNGVDVAANGNDIPAAPGYEWDWA